MMRKHIQKCKRADSNKYINVSEANGIKNEMY